MRVSTVLASMPPQICVGSLAHGMSQRSLGPCLPYESPHEHTDTVSDPLRAVCTPPYR